MRTGIIGGTMKITAMEPMMPRVEATMLDDLAFDLVARANHLAGQIQPGVRESIGDLVRSMNCYYSNLIEGHDTHPRDIDAALEEHYSDDADKRILQREARAHIEVQRLIDFGYDPDEAPTSTKYIQWLHREFCEKKTNYGVRPLILNPDITIKDLTPAH